MSDIAEVMAWGVCPHLWNARADSPALCQNCPATIETEYGPGTNLCRMLAVDAARAALAALEKEGWVVVPRGIVERAADALNDAGWSEGKALRAAMLAASKPSPLAAPAVRRPEGPKSLPDPPEDEGRDESRRG